MRQWATTRSVWRGSTALICLALAALGAKPLAGVTATPLSTLERIHQDGVLVAGIGW